MLLPFLQPNSASLQRRLLGSCDHLLHIGDKFGMECAPRLREPATKRWNFERVLRPTRYIGGRPVPREHRLATYLCRTAHPRAAVADGDEEALPGLGDD